METNVNNATEPQHYAKPMLAVRCFLKLGKPLQLICGQRVVVVAGQIITMKMVKGLPCY